MQTKKTTTKTASRQKTAVKNTRNRSKKISNVSKPDSMTLPQWQTALRRQAAEDESLNVSEIDPKGSPGEYHVSNFSSRSSYHVYYYGDGHKLNTCSCMDYRASRLGTCKHMEAVKMWIAEKRNRTVHRPDLGNTLMYVDYSAEPRLRLRYGRDDRDAMKNVFGEIFDLNGELQHSLKLMRVPDALREASSISASFICRDDAQAFLNRRQDDFVRRERLNCFFRDPEWWKDIFVKGIVPYRYQQEGIRFAANAGRCIIADEMGLGKTLQGIGTAALLRKEGFVDSVLIVCPTSLKYQ